MSLPQIAANFAAIASCVEARQPDATLIALLKQTQSLCRAAAAGERSSELKSLLLHVQTATNTWQEVWPRLGSQRDFRGAVAREARLWSQRLLAQQAQSVH